jgi:hypothetical protein
MTISEDDDFLQHRQSVSEGDSRKSRSRLTLGAFFILPVKVEARVCIRRLSWKHVVVDSLLMNRSKCFWFMLAE